MTAADAVEAALAKGTGWMFILDLRQKTGLPARAVGQALGCLYRRSRIGTAIGEEAFTDDGREFPWANVVLDVEIEWDAMKRNPFDAGCIRSLHRHGFKDEEILWARGVLAAMYLEEPDSKLRYPAVFVRKEG